ncbi:hypothetical protein [Roseomonas fluvialis]|uniref:SPOR domain-containing protein n=1 Tax=Roseomonas fluvialis TaxID=1750527 RepID=A0ABM7Y7I2_9PROT|nr:hypothetical protein [Roseomonas fluvialis]BDG73982.1 hypothetical protein Rmf_39110 [Roseomonas fluvialis]
MNPLQVRARLFLLAASVLVLLAGMMIAVGRWNAAETDRAFVDAAARAAALPETTLPPRYWAPTAAARPGPTVTSRIEAIEAARSLPPAPARAEPTQAPSSAKPPAAAR